MKAAQDYIDKLAIKLNTKVVQKPCLAGMMYVEYEPPMIEGPTFGNKDPKHPDEQCKFLCLLHELGHVFYGHTQGRPPYTNKRYYFENGVLKSEAEAWHFALNHFWESGIWSNLSQIARNYMWENCLGSYYRGSLRQDDRPLRLGNGNRHYVEFIYDKPTEFFWNVKDRMIQQS